MTRNIVKKEKYLQRSNGSFIIDKTFTERSKTDETLLDEVNVNSIMAKFKKTGQLTHLSQRIMKYADMSNITTLGDALDIITKSREDFLQLPSEIRAKFGNDPIQFVEYVNNPENFEELTEMGLLTKETTKPVEVIIKEKPTQNTQKQPDPA